MLSILQRQAKLLEKELKDKQKECLELNQTTRELQGMVATRDSRIEVLEAELAALQGNVEREEDSEPGEAENIAEKHLDSGELDDLRKSLGELTDKLDSCEGKLTFAELRASVLALQKTTAELTHMGVVRSLKASLTTCQSDLVAARKAQREDEAMQLELTQAKSDLIRRDEQLEFLMHVHEASSSYEWVGGGSGSNRTAAGSGSSAVTLLASQPGGGTLVDPGVDPRGTSALLLSMVSGRPQQEAAAVEPPRQGPMGVLLELGVDPASAQEALVAAGWDVDMAVLSLFPAD